MAYSSWFVFFYCGFPGGTRYIRMYVHILVLSKYVVKYVCAARQKQCLVPTLEEHGIHSILHAVRHYKLMSPLS